MKLLFIINPISGGKAKVDWENGIREFFKDLPHTIEIFILSGENDASSIEHHLIAVSPDRVIAVGGDGTIKLVAEVLQQTDIPLGILPAGSANGMAKELGIPLLIEEALDIIVNGEVKKIDLVKINDNDISLHLSDIGLNAMIIKYYDESKARGWWSYGRALLRVLWEKQKFTCTIKTDDAVIRRRAFMVVIANAKQYGMGAVINPEGNLSDSLFEVVIVRRLNVFAVLNGIITKKSFDPKKIEVLPTKELELTTRKKVHFQVDGEYKGKIKHLTASILPKALHVILPPDQVE